MEEETPEYRGIYAYAFGTVVAVVLSLKAYSMDHIIVFGLPVMLLAGAVCLGTALTFFTRMVRKMRELQASPDNEKVVK